MILRRLGNKQAIAHKIIPYFPPHKIYIEPFFGAGGMFFNKPKAKYNIVNDLDSDVFNLFQVVMNQKEELKQAFYMMPIHSDLLEYWKKNKETDPIKKALRFLLLSNFTFMGTGTALIFTSADSKGQLMKMLDETNKMIFGVQFDNDDFRRFLKKPNFTKGDNFRNESFIYADPPYLGTTDNYNNSFTEQDSIDLFDTLQATGCKFAMSEFNHPFILQQAKERGLNVHIIGERRNLKNRRTEILVTNYKNNPTLFDVPFEK
jgi:DNA adenine methylase